MMLFWQSNAPTTKSLRVISKIKLGNTQGARTQLLFKGLPLSTANSAALWPYFMYAFLQTEGFSAFSSKLLSPGGPCCLSEAGCFKPQLCSPSAASGLSSHNPSISRSAKCRWRQAKIELYSCTVAKAIINGQKLIEVEGEEGVWGKNTKSKMQPIIKAALVNLNVSDNQHKREKKYSVTFSK